RVVRSLDEACVGIAGFLIKELTSILRQPRLILGLVLGPFAIMVVFGVGYHGPSPHLRTLLVLPPQPAIAQQVNILGIYEQGLSGVFQLEGITHDRAAAMAQLKANTADVVVVVPANLYEQIRTGKQARLSV